MRAAIAAAGPPPPTMRAPSSAEGARVLFSTQLSTHCAMEPIMRSCAVFAGGAAAPAVGGGVWGVAGFAAGRVASEESRRDRGVAARGAPVGAALDVVVAAENLLDHHAGALRLAGGVGALGAEFVPVGRRE